MKLRIAVLLSLLTFVSSCQGEEKNPNLERDLAAVAEALKSGKDTGAILADPAYVSLHPEQHFREMIRQHATAKSVLVTSQEPGTPLVVTGVVKDDAGKPIAGAMVYVFHTDHRGYYSATSAFAGSQADNSDRSRIFGYLKTDADGKYEYRTIRPAGYPNARIPQHVHYEVKADGHKTNVTELMFEDDLRMTAESKQQALRAKFILSPVRKDDKGVEHCTCDIVLARSKGK
jgi:protocatechuate 3,4-dioxygenase, beta subunit